MIKMRNKYIKYITYIHTYTEIYIYTINKQIYIYIYNVNQES